jgi:hypothetical protein
MACMASLSAAANAMSSVNASTFNLFVQILNSLSWVFKFRCTWECLIEGVRLIVWEGLIAREAFIEERVLLKGGVHWMEGNISFMRLRMPQLIDAVIQIWLYNRMNTVQLQQLYSYINIVVTSMIIDVVNFVVSLQIQDKIYILVKAVVAV